MTFPLRIFAIDREIFVGDAKSLTVPGEKGQFQILADHASLISSLKAGDVIIVAADDTTHKIPIAGGTVEVNEKEVVALVNF